MPLPNGAQYALAPELAKLLPLFTANNLAVLLNAGTLVQPTTKAEDQAHVSLPPKLLSHNDQQSYWPASSPADPAPGRSGRITPLSEAGSVQAAPPCTK